MSFPQPTFDMLQYRAGPAAPELRIRNESYLRVLRKSCAGFPNSFRNTGTVIDPCSPMNTQYTSNTMFLACMVLGMNLQELEIPAWQHPLPTINAWAGSI